MRGSLGAKVLRPWFRGSFGGKSISVQVPAEARVSINSSWAGHRAPHPSARDNGGTRTRKSPPLPWSSRALKGGWTLLLFPLDLSGSNPTAAAPPSSLFSQSGISQLQQQTGPLTAGCGGLWSNSWVLFVPRDAERLARPLSGQLSLHDLIFETISTFLLLSRSFSHQPLKPQILPHSSYQTP